MVLPSSLELEVVWNSRTTSAAKPGPGREPRVRGVQPGDRFATRPLRWVVCDGITAGHRIRGLETRGSGKKRGRRFGARLRTGGSAAYRGCRFTTFSSTKRENTPRRTKSEARSAAAKGTRPNSASTGLLLGGLFVGPLIDALWRGWKPPPPPRSVRAPGRSGRFDAAWFPFVSPLASGGIAGIPVPWRRWAGPPDASRSSVRGWPGRALDPADAALTGRGLDLKIRAPRKESRIGQHQVFAEEEPTADYSRSAQSHRRSPPCARRSRLCAPRSRPRTSSRRALCCSRRSV